MIKSKFHMSNFAQTINVTMNEEFCIELFDLLVNSDARSPQLGVFMEALEKNMNMIEKYRPYKQAVTSA